jgi:hypothetical protein
MEAAHRSDQAPIAASALIGVQRRLLSGFDANLATVRNDFRVDLAGRSTVVAPRVARSQFPNRYAVAWKDNRAGHDDVYTRLVPSP